MSTTDRSIETQLCKLRGIIRSNNNKKRKGRSDTGLSAFSFYIPGSLAKPLAVPLYRCTGYHAVPDITAVRHEKSAGVYYKR